MGERIKTVLNTRGGTPRELGQRSDSSPYQKPPSLPHPCLLSPLRLQDEHPAGPPAALGLCLAPVKPQRNPSEIPALG